MGQKTEGALESAWLNCQQELTVAMERIEELEASLACCNAECGAAMKYARAAEQESCDAQAAAQAQSETVQRDWLSPAEAEGLRRQLEIGYQARRNLITTLDRHVTDMLDYWKQEAAR